MIQAAAIAALVAAAVGLGVGWKVRDGQCAKAELARVQEDQRMAEKAIGVERDARRTVEAIANDTHKKLVRARANAADALDALAGLRSAANAAGAECAAPSAAAAGHAASAPGLVLADVLGRTGGRATELAAALDEAHAAGAACERAYNAVMQGQPPSAAER